MVQRSRNQGELEAQIMSALWDARDEGLPGLTSHEVLAKVSPNGGLAITTVLTVLSRLTDKESVIRCAGPGRSFIFSAAQTRAQHDAAILLSVFEGSDNPLLAFSHFAKNLTPEQLSALRNTISQ